MVQKQSRPSTLPRIGSCRRAVVEVQHPAQPLTALDLTARARSDTRRLDQSIGQALMISLRVRVSRELNNSAVEITQTSVDGELGI